MSFKEEEKEVDKEPTASLTHGCAMRDVREARFRGSFSRLLSTKSSSLGVQDYRRGGPWCATLPRATVLALPGVVSLGAGSSDIRVIPSRGLASLSCGTEPSQRTITTVPRDHTSVAKPYPLPSIISMLQC
jgi:hypothetical protein